MTASSICRPVGSLQSSGTGTRAHSNPGSQAVQSIPLAADAVVGGDAVVTGGALVGATTVVDPDPASLPTSAHATRRRAATTASGTMTCSNERRLTTRACADRLKRR